MEEEKGTLWGERHSAQQWPRCCRNSFLRFSYWTCTCVFAFCIPVYCRSCQLAFLTRAPCRSVSFLFCASFLQRCVCARLLLCPQLVHPVGIFIALFHSASFDWGCHPNLKTICCVAVKHHHWKVSLHRNMNPCSFAAKTSALFLFRFFFFFMPSSFWSCTLGFRAPLFEMSCFRAHSFLLRLHRADIREYTHSHTHAKECSMVQMFVKPWKPLLPSLDTNILLWAFHLHKTRREE